MKGILKKTEEGWFVVFDQRTMQDPSAEEGILPLHPIDVKMIDEDSKVFDHIETRIRTYPEVEFEVRMYDGKSHISNAWNGYAKIVDSYPVSEDCEEVKNWDSFVEKKNAELEVERLAELSSELQEATYTPQHKTTYKHGFIDGYNKAKETLYTEEQVKKAYFKGAADVHDKCTDRTWRGVETKVDIELLKKLNAEYIQSLKQPKKD